MTRLFVVRIAGVFALLAVAAQFAAFCIAFASGIQPGAPLDFSDGQQLLAAGNVSAGVLGLVLATISPSLGLPLGLALYVVLKKDAAERCTSRVTPCLDSSVREKATTVCLRRVAVVCEYC